MFGVISRSVCVVALCMLPIAALNGCGSEADGGGGQSGGAGGEGGDGGGSGGSGGTSAGLCDRKDCSDGNECTSDTCDAASGECANPAVLDGIACDGRAGTCQSGACEASPRCAVINCGDDNECTSDVCNPANGTCTNPAVGNGPACDGGNGTCQDGVCEAGNNPPAAPSGFTAAAISPTEIQLTWTDRSNNEDGFKLSYSWDSCAVFLRPSDLAPNTESARLSDLNPETNYCFRIAAFNENAQSAWATATTTTPGSGVPAAPSGLTATAISENEIQLAWNDVSNNEDGFTVYEAVGSCNAGFADLGDVDPNSETVRIHSLAADTFHCYRIVAFNSVGESAFSNTAFATTQSSSATLRIVNDLSNVSSDRNWGIENGIVHVRIGPYYDVVGVYCGYLANDASKDRLNPGIVNNTAQPRIGNSIEPGYTNPGSFNIEEFDVSEFSGDNSYCVYVQAGWWGPAVGTSTWKINATAVTSCQGVSLGVFKDAWFPMNNHTSGTLELRLSQVLPHTHFQGTLFCQ